MFVCVDDDNIQLLTICHRSSNYIRHEKIVVDEGIESLIKEN